MKKGLFIVTLFIAACSNNHNHQPHEEADDQKSERLQKIMTVSPDDQDLHDDVKKFLKHNEDKQWSNNAHVYIWGMKYETDDVYATGLEIAQKLSELNQNHDYNSQYDFDFMNKYTEIKQPEHDEFCSSRLSECFTRFLADIEEKYKQASQYETLRKRYQELLSYNDYSDVTEWVLDDNFTVPTFTLLTRGMEINQIYWLKDLKNGLTQPVITQLFHEATQLKNWLKQADSLIAKMVFVHLYAEHLEFINGALNAGLLKVEQIREIPSLNYLVGEALSLEKAILKEEKVKLILVKTVFKPEHIEEPFVNLFFPDLPGKMVKPNLTLNQLYFDFVLPLVDYLNLSPGDFYAALEDFDFKVEFDEIENAAATIFNASSEEIKNRYLTYQSRMFSLNMKIKLLNALIEQGSAQKVIEKAAQGYTPYLNDYDQSKPYLSENKICFKGVLELEERYRCLNTFKKTNQ